jgi:hypothetical protein
MRAFNLAGGLFIFAVSWIMLVLDIEPFPSWFYCFMWWSYILIIDGWVFLRTGNSLLLNRTREFLFLLPVSILIWLIFECINLLLKNWYYVNVIEITWLRWIGYSISFATVLPAIFETAELLESTALLNRWQVKPRNFAPIMLNCCMLAGAGFIILCIAWPRYFFPLVWGGFILALDPVNYRLGAPSLLKEWERGSLRKTALLMTSGLLCGIFWEFWNFWATTKWVYTVPFLNEFKLFEMTAPGFLGFIPFALECYVMTACIYLFRKNIGWERDTCQTVRMHRFNAVIRFSLVCCSAFFCFAVLKAIDRTTVDSFRPYLKEITTIPAERRARLEQCGIIMVKDLVRLKSAVRRQQEALQCIAASRDELSVWIKSAEMVMLKGMGTHNFLLLSKAGITDIDKLAQQDAHTLRMSLEQLIATEDDNARIPDEAKINVWIRAAQNTI